MRARAPKAGHAWRVLALGIAALAIAALLAAIFVGYQHPALLIDFGGINFCG